MGLSERKKEILRIVVDDYINTAEPVSSKSITQNHLKTLSSATIRSELSALEEMGFLKQLHTSSGRVPSAEAYKLYVSELMQKKDLSAGEIDYIKNFFNEKADDLEYVVKNTVKIISELTNYTSIALSKLDKNDKIINIKLIKVRIDSALLLIITENTFLKDHFITIPKDMTEQNLETANKMLNNIFAGKRLYEIKDIESEVSNDFYLYREIFNRVMDVLKDYGNSNEGEIMVNGEDKIFAHQEYGDIDKVKNFLSVVTDKDKLTSLLSNEENNIEMRIKIGHNVGDNIPEDCSLITAQYSAGNVNIGTYGVIGPIRMDYNKVITVLENVGKIIENIINNR